jgi:FMN phosphatase YigB (HAD superfamily)
MNDLVIVVDLDGTLKTEHDAVGPFETETLTVQSGSKVYTFAVRPYIHDFLKAASSKARLYLGTAGGGGYARRVLKAMGIENYFDRIIAAEDFGRGIRFMKNCIFIDNDTETGQLKMGKMAATYTRPIRQDLWTIDTFLGNADDKTMLELIEEIKTL